MRKNRLFAVSLIAVMMGTAAHADIASTKYVDDAVSPIDARVTANETAISNKQNKLTAGSNITIGTDGTISATDTTYTTGTSTTAGLTKLYSMADVEKWLASENITIENLPTDGTITAAAIAQVLFLAGYDDTEIRGRLERLESKLEGFEPSNYVTTTDLDSRGYVTTSDLDLRDYATTGYVDAAINNNTPGFAYNSELLEGNGNPYNLAYKTDLDGFAYESNLNPNGDNTSNDYGFAYSSELSEGGSNPYSLVHQTDLNSYALESNLNPNGDNTSNNYGFAYASEVTAAVNEAKQYVDTTAAAAMDVVNEKQDKLTTGANGNLLGAGNVTVQRDANGKITITGNVDTALSATSTNPVQNKAVNAAITDVNKAAADAKTAADAAAETANAAQSTADTALATANAAIPSPKSFTPNDGGTLVLTYNTTTQEYAWETIDR